MRKIKSGVLAILLFSLIYVLTGPPREGKTFYATYRALQILKKGKEKVFSNYPIVYAVPLPLSKKVKNRFIKLYNWVNIQLRSGRPDVQLYRPHILSSFVWEKSLMKDPLYDCSIFIDEAYDDYFSREWKEFEKKQLEWFATNGHNLLDVWIIAQNSAFVDVNIRRLTNYFIRMKKRHVLFGMGFLWFEAQTFLSESEMNMNNRKLDLTYSKDRLTLRNDVMNSYDTHYFRDTRKEKTYQTWHDKFQIVPETKFRFNYGKVILVSLVLLSLSVFIEIMLKIFVL
ncbi:Uncharacterised protein [uncultured archaeon]|nr:Uncharacterised protein [uncultured archaeon]